MYKVISFLLLNKDMQFLASIKNFFFKVYPENKKKHLISQNNTIKLFYNDVSDV